MESEEYKVEMLGKGRIKSPLKPTYNTEGMPFVCSENDRILMDSSLRSVKNAIKNNIAPVSFERAGPHRLLFFDPQSVKAAIVTCGGVCPGINNVIRSIVNELYYRYNVNNIIGIQYGFQGFISSYNHPVIELSPEMVDKIHLFGGTILGSSRGKQNITEIVDRLVELEVNILFCIGGDGTLRGAHAIYEEITRRNLRIGVGGIPKTIDNDINLIDKSFGFETAFSIASEFIRYAHNEAKGAFNGVAILKLMGRQSGFIAAYASLSIQDANFVLIPEMDFDFDGPGGFLEALRKRLENRHHALVVVAEGAGQKFFENEPVEKDPSGNIKNKDIGIYLKEKISTEFEAMNFPVSIKYIDPSYIIRSAPANANDSKFCGLLAQHAVHAAMAGKTDFVVGHWNHFFTLLPVSVAVGKRKQIDVHDELWWNVLETTGQPVSMLNIRN